MESRQQDEVEVCWGGYSPRAVVPELLCCLLATTAIILLAWYVSELHWLPVRVPRYLAEVVIVLLWVLQLVSWLYRITARTYRLTTRRLFLLSQFQMPCVGIPLDRIREIRVSRSWFDHRLGLGRVHLRLEERKKPLVIQGVEQPDQFVQLLREQVARVRLLEEEKASRK